MKKYHSFTILIFATILTTLTAGIYRHDRPIERYLQLAKQDEFNCVGQLFKLEGKKWNSSGSFVLIDSMTILSAAHCFIGTSYRDTIINRNGKSISTRLAISKFKKDESEFRFFIMNMQLKAKSIVIHPNYITNGNCDLAIIKLEKPIIGTNKLAINTLFTEMKDTVVGVGFGVSGPANKIDLVSIYNIKLAGKNIIDSIGGAILDGNNTMLFADFDSPDSLENCNKLGDSTPLDLEYSIGAGDSGGPLFKYEDGNLVLLGIATYAPKTVSNLLKNGYYCELNGWTRLSAFNSWIERNQ